MAITVRDLLKLPYFEPVTVVAGQAGLDRAVTAAGILDYEYAEGYTMKEQVFRKNDLLVSSLLFAKDAPQNLLNMLQDLIDLGATGLAYKSVLIDTLPDEVLRLADEHDFPILKFGMNLYLEEFVFQIMDNVKLERQLAEKEELLDALIAENLPKEELNQAAKRIDSSLGHYLYSVYISGKKRMEYHDFERLYRGPTGVTIVLPSVATATAISFCSPVKLRKKSNISTFFGTLLLIWIWERISAGWAAAHWYDALKGSVAAYSRHTSPVSVPRPADSTVKTIRTWAYTSF